MPLPTALNRLLLNGHSIAATGGNFYVDGTALVSSTGAQNIQGQKTFANGVVANRMSGQYIYQSGASTIAIDLLNRRIQDEYGTIAISYGSGGRRLNDDNGTLVLNWGVSQCYNSLGFTTLDWSGRLLSGDWQTDTTPTLGTHLVNLSYFNANTGALSGAFYPLYGNPSGFILPSQTGSILDDTVVRTTGTQAVTGTKNFLYIGVSQINLTGNIIYANGNPLQGIHVPLGLLRKDISTYTLDWMNRYLSGAWLTNGVPTEAFHIVNLLALTGASGALRSDISALADATGSLKADVSALSGSLTGASGVLREDISLLNSSTGCASPSQYPGLIAWFDASVLTDTYQSTTGIMPVHNTPINAWLNLAPNIAPYDGSATGGSRPLYQTGVQNGKPGLLFDGVDDYMSFSMGMGAYIGKLNNSQFIVCRPTKYHASGAGSSYNRAGIVAGIGDWNGVSIHSGAGGNIFNFWTYDAAALVSATCSTSVVPTGQTVLVVQEHATGYIKIAASGATPSSAASRQKYQDGNPAYIGRTPLHYFGGYIFEIIEYPRLLTPKEKSGVVSYLNTKWGL